MYYFPREYFALGNERIDQVREGNELLWKIISKSRFRVRFYEKSNRNNAPLNPGKLHVALKHKKEKNN